MVSAQNKHTFRLERFWIFIKYFAEKDFLSADFIDMSHLLDEPVKKLDLSLSETQYHRKGWNINELFIINLKELTLGFQGTFRLKRVCPIYNGITHQQGVRYRRFLAWKLLNSNNLLILSEAEMRSPL